MRSGRASGRNLHKMTGLFVCSCPDYDSCILEWSRKCIVYGASHCAPLLNICLFLNVSLRHPADDQKPATVGQKGVHKRRLPSGSGERMLVVTVPSG